MRIIYKLSISWIIALIYYPIGLQWIISNNPIGIFFAFFITTLIRLFMIYYTVKLIKEFREVKE